MNRRQLAAATCLGLALASQTAWSQTRWDLPSGYGVNTFQVQNLQWFADEVDKATAGKLKITLHPGASLFKANEIKRAVQTGQTQIGEFILSGAANENALFGVDSIPFLATTYEQARKLDGASRPALDKLLASQGMTLLYTVPWPGQSLYSKKPVSSLADLKGTKMRAYNPATTRIAELVGAQAVTIQLAELPQALATGGVDNFLTSSASGVDSKLYEQVKFFYDVNAWLPRNAVVVNQKAFEALDPATRAAVQRVAVAAGDRGWKVSDQKDDEYLKELGARGMTVDRSSAKLKAELKAIGERMTGEWLRQAGAEGQAIIDAYRK
ncbi:MAG: TRAP transporter substrate-binding protein [Rubrivivax sp.]|nr:TRAP transporter substrate-binding protein [Rubrivivax sp.]